MGAPGPAMTPKPVVRPWLVRTCDYNFQRVVAMPVAGLPVTTQRLLEGHGGLMRSSYIRGSRCERTPPTSRG